VDGGYGEEGASVDGVRVGGGGGGVRGGFVGSAPAVERGFGFALISSPEMGVALDVRWKVAVVERGSASTESA
jgi:hypothetical protein